MMYYGLPRTAGGPGIQKSILKNKLKQPQKSLTKIKKL